MAGLAFNRNHMDRLSALVESLDHRADFSSASSAYKRLLNIDLRTYGDGGLPEVIFN